MKNSEDENIEKLVEQMFAHSRLERPSVDFTQTVMSEILTLGKSKSLVYKPILSRLTWLIIFAGIIALFIYSFLNSGSTSSTFNFNLTVYNMERLGKILQPLEISSMTGNVILFATLMILIQIFFLKKYLDKRLES